MSKRKVMGFIIIMAALCVWCLPFKKAMGQEEPGPCIDPYFCDDGDPCTSDICINWGECSHDPIPGCCQPSSECDDSNPQTIDYCSGGTCYHDYRSCYSDGECDDYNPDTEDHCSMGMCYYEPSYCYSDEECNDYNPDTEDHCWSGDCYHNSWQPPPDPCMGMYCDDGNPCTTDYCADGMCHNDTISGCCQYDFECNDSDPCTGDYCTGNVCNHEPLNCDDGDWCTNDYCSYDGCHHDSIPCCGNPDPCCGSGPCCGMNCDDDNPCTDDICDMGTCRHEPISGSGCCRYDSDCEDGDPCTADHCSDLDNSCHHEQIPACCHDDSECDDHDWCTEDHCSDNECHHWVYPCCGVNCDDDNPCTVDICDMGTCRHAPISGSGCCWKDSDCEDGDPCTADHCSDLDNSCHHEQIPACCHSDLECDDHDDWCTRDYCSNNECHHERYLCCDMNCDDGDPSTGDRCDAGMCFHEPTINCSDNNSCTTDSCSWWVCYHEPAAAGCCQVDSECDDGNLQTDNLCIDNFCFHPPGTQMSAITEACHPSDFFNTVYSIDDIYVSATLPVPEGTYTFCLVEHKTLWRDGDSLYSSPGFVSSKQISLDSSGNFCDLFWTPPAGDHHDYDIILDVNGNGSFESTIDYLDTMVSTREKGGWAAKWDFDEGHVDPSTNTIFDPINGNNGTIHGGVSLTNGISGNALYFDGVTGYVDVPNSPSLAINGYQLSIEAWIKPQTVNGYRTIVSSYPIGGYYLRVQNGGIEFYGYGTITTDPGIVPAGLWSHVVATFDGTMSSIFLNGQLVKRGHTASHTMISSSGDLRIGAWPYSTELPFVGIIDELAIYNRVLSPAEVQAQYTRYTPGGPSQMSSDRDCHPREIFNTASSPVADIHVSATLPVSEGMYVFYLVEDKASWTDGDPLCSPGCVASASIPVDSNGSFCGFLWTPPANDNHHYNIIMDVNGNGLFDTNTDFIDSTLRTDGGGDIVARWNMDEGVGSAILDSSIHGNNGTIHEATWTEGISGTALYFDGANSYVDVPNSTSIAIDDYQFSIEAWVNPQYIYGCYTILNAYSYDSNGYYLRIKDGYIDFNGLIGNNAGTIPTDSWSHIVGTFDGTMASIFLNGQLVKRGQVWPDPAKISAPYPLKIGAWPPIEEFQFPQIPFYGTIDEITIYNKVLSLAEVQQHYSLHSGLELCDEIDNDCDGTIDEGFDVGQPCTVGVGACQATGSMVCKADGSGTECNVTAGAPATEICDGIDNNCDGTVDEGVKHTYYRDIDGDGYGTASVTIEGCEAPNGYVADNTDCDDTDPAIHPRAFEVRANGKDDNCNEQIDEITYSTITFNFINHTDGSDLTGTGGERVYVTGYAWKANGDQITVEAGTTISYRAYYKESTSLCGPWLSHLCTASAILPVVYQPLSMNFEDQDGDLNPSGGRGTGDERVSIDQVGYKADNDTIVVPLNSTISFCAYFKQGSGLSGIRDSLTVNGSFDKVPVHYQTLTTDFEDQSGDLNPSGGRGTGNERVYIDYVGYKADGETITLPLSSTINYRAYFKQDSVLYGPKSTLSVDGSTDNLLVHYHTITMNFVDQSGDLDPASGRGTGNERVYIDYVDNYKADGETVTLPLPSTISYRAHFKQASGLYGPKSSVIVDGSWNVLTAQYRTVRFDILDSFSNPVSGAQLYVDNAGYVQNGGLFTAPLSGTMYHRANVGSVWSTKTSKKVDGAWTGCTYQWNGAAFGSPAYLP